jgi:carbohydrate binding protein with CBM4/9 domain
MTAIGRVVARSSARPQALLVWAQMTLFLAALALPLTAASVLDRPLGVPGPISVYPSDLIVGLAIAVWLGARLLVPNAMRQARLRTPVLGLPLLLFGLALLPGIVRGHGRYGESLIAQPLRLVAYAAIAFALTELRPRDVYRGVVAVFYVGTVWAACLGVYYLATGTSQTPVSELSTGGQRVLSLTTGMYLASALVLALINLEVEGRGRRRRRFLHLAIGALALFGIGLAFGRTTFLAIGVLLPFLVWQLPQLRRTVIRRWHWWVPVAVLAVAAVAVLAPNFRATFVDRVTANPLTDHSVRWRARRIEAALSGMRSGQWQNVDEPPALAVDNALVNPGFEDGVERWYQRSAYIRAIDSNNPTFGAQTLDVTTQGDVIEEGFSSTSVPASPGQTWTFSVWLRGTVGGEHVAVAIREYDAQGDNPVRAALPVRLTITPTQYFVRWTVRNPKTTRIRGSVRTTGQPATIEFYADSARLTHDVASAGAVSANPASPDGGVLSPVFGPKGFWEPAARLEPTGPDGLASGTFESGTSGWSARGATTRIVPADTRRFGSRSLELRTNGTDPGEGIRSAPVPVKKDQTYTFQIWLYTKHGDEQMFVSVWQYDATAKTVNRFDFPVTLTSTPTRYSVTTQIRDSDVTQIRAFVRTRTAAQKTVVYMDNAALRLRANLDSVPGVHPAVRREPRGSQWQIDEPLLGLGFGRLVDYTWDGLFYEVEGDPDNSYVFLFAGGGILALGGFLLLMAFYAKDSWRLFRRASGVERALVGWALASWFLLLVNMAMAPFLPRPKIELTLWTLLLLPALVRRSRDERRSQYRFELSDRTAP